MIYYLLIILLFFLSVVSFAKIEMAKMRLAELLIFLLIVLIGGFRFEVGADWFSYKESFYRISSFEDVISSRSEFLYSFFSYVFNSFFGNYSFFVLVFFLISFLLKFNIIKYLSPNVFLSLIIYIYTVFLIYDLNGIRQGMAIGIVMYSIRFVISRNFKLFLISLLIACLFHTSALVFLPFYFLSNINLSNRLYLVFLFIFVLLAIPMRNFILNSTFFNYVLMADAFSHYSVYTTSDNYKMNVSIISIATLQRALVFILYLLVYENIDANEGVKKILKNAYFIGFILFLILSFSAEFSARLSFYYKSFEIVMIPLIITSFPKLYQKVIIIAMFVIFAIMGTYRLLILPDGMLIPYRSLL